MQQDNKFGVRLFISKPRFKDMTMLSWFLGYRESYVIENLTHSNMRIIVGKTYENQLCYNIKYQIHDWFYTEIT